LATLAYITHPACALHEMGPDHPECPERLASISDHVIAIGLDGLIARHEATPATREQLARVHTSAYVDAVSEAAPTSGLRYLDPDTALNPHSIEAALHASGAIARSTQSRRRRRKRSAFDRPSRGAPPGEIPCSTTSPSAPRMRWPPTACRASRSSISTSTTATAPSRCSPTTRAC
jgi:acetoin utilization deacetylase AcuC-like enzyme